MYSKNVHLEHNASDVYEDDSYIKGKETANYIPQSILLHVNIKIASENIPVRISLTSHKAAISTKILAMLTSH